MSDQASSRLEPSQAQPQNFVDALNLLAQRDGVKLNAQFTNDVTKLTGGMMELQSQGVLPNVDLQNALAGGSGNGSYVRDAAPVDSKTSGDSHTPGTLDSLWNGATPDFIRGGVDLGRAAGDVALAPIDGVYQGLKGTIGGEVHAVEDFAHGDVLGGVGNMVAAPLEGAFDATKGVVHETWDATKNVWHAAQNEFNSATHTVRGLFDYIRGAGDVALAPVAGAWDALTGTIGSEVTAVKDFAHGDIVGGVGHLVGAPIIGAVHGVEGVAHKTENAVKNVWHGIENIF